MRRRILQIRAHRHRMRWSKLQKRFEQLVAPALRRRLKIHVTSYRETKGMDVGRGWITIDGEEVLSVQTPSFYDNRIIFEPETLSLGRAVGAYVGMSLGEARSSPDPVVRGLAFLDRRLGKRSLGSVNKDRLHAFEKALSEIRFDAEGVAP
jgi:hypothetical protein